jgi:hypothetical protein
MRRRPADLVACLVLAAFTGAAQADDPVRLIRLNPTMTVDPVEDEVAVKTLESAKWGSFRFRRNDDLPGTPVSHVTLINEADDKLLAALERLPYLRSATQINQSAEITDSLCRLRQLEDLELSGAELGISNAKALGGLPRLRALTLDTCGGVTDAALEEISKAPRLVTLRLNQSADFTLKGVKELRRLKHLKELWLMSTKLTNGTLKEVAEWTNLQVLDLSNTTITRNELKELSQSKVTVKALPCACWGSGQCERACFRW